MLKVLYHTLLKNMAFVLTSVFSMLTAMLLVCGWQQIDILISVFIHVHLCCFLLLALMVSVVLHLSSWHELGLQYYLGMHRMTE
jgi:hypothetical protein